jgi:deoxycytidine triphosphate deaminase/cell division protein FtsL
MPDPPPYREGDMPGSDDEAAARFADTRFEDPLPQIEPALLNTADLLDYVIHTGMVFPFPTASDLTKVLKPASCAIPVQGPYRYWKGPKDPDKETQPELVTGVLEPGDEFTLERNSIVYLSLAPMFRMPDYIAARYNLKIRQIYRGILVGTGPLVDPGFVGPLSIPLHNLTGNDYRITGGELLVWMEFTKLSHNERWRRGYERTDPKTFYVPFPERKAGQTLHDYVSDAFPGPIRSSIPESVERSAISATKASNAAEALRKRFQNISLIAVVTIVVAIAGLVYAGYTVVQSAESVDDNVRESYSGLRDEVAMQKQQITQLKGAVQELRKHRR